MRCITIYICGGKREARKDDVDVRGGVGAAGGASGWLDASKQ